MADLWIVGAARRVLCVCLCFLPIACSSLTGVPRVADQLDTACPAPIENDIKVLASGASADDSVVTADSAHMTVRRRMLISLSPGAAASGLHLLGSTLTVTSIGGTFRELLRATDGRNLNGTDLHSIAEVRQIAAARAIDVIPGRVRVAPFITGATLHAQTLAMDMLVAPGGAATDEMVIAHEAMWDARRRPLSSAQVTISLRPVRHFTMYDEVRATVSLNMVLGRARSARQQWSCSAESAFTLVDRAAATPDLWDLRKVAPAGASELWLALFNSQSGSFRAVFASPADAAGFADWLRQTHAHTVGGYRLGMFRPGYSREQMHTVPVSHSVADTFQEVTADDLDALVVGRLGEP